MSGYPNPGNGGSTPGAVRQLDLGVVTNADLEDGPITLYTPAAGEIIGPVFLRDVTLPNNFGIEIRRDEQVDDGDPLLFQPPLAGVDNDTSYDGSEAGEVKGHQSAFTGFLRATPTTDGPVTAALVYGIAPNTPIEPWQANHHYDPDKTVQAVIEAGHIWSSSDDFTSGGSQPDFAGNVGGSVADNGGTWNDDGAAPTGGSIHVYAFAAVPVEPD